MVHEFYYIIIYPFQGYITHVAFNTITQHNYYFNTSLILHACILRISLGCIPRNRIFIICPTTLLYSTNHLRNLHVVFYCCCGISMQKKIMFNLYLIRLFSSFSFYISLFLYSCFVAALHY